MGAPPASRGHCEPRMRCESIADARSQRLYLPMAANLATKARALAGDRNAFKDILPGARGSEAESPGQLHRSLRPQLERRHPLGRPDVAGTRDAGAGLLQADGGS